MPYSETDMEAIERDPVRLRAYYWHMTQHWRRMAREMRDASRQTGRAHPVTNYRPAFLEGREEMRHAEVLERLAEHVSENIDALVETTGRWPA
jgi:hypothetical protein